MLSFFFFFFFFDFFNSSKGWRMVLQKLWVSQNFTRISRVSQSRFFAVMCVSQSRFLYEGVSHLKQFEVSVSQSKKSKCLGLAKKNASLAVSQSLAFTIRHPCSNDSYTSGIFTLSRSHETMSQTCHANELECELSPYSRESK